MNPRSGVCTPLPYPILTTTTAVNTRPSPTPSARRSIGISPSIRNAFLKPSRSSAEPSGSAPVEADETGADVASISASHFSELGGWCRPGGSGKDFDHISIRRSWGIELLVRRFVNHQDLIDGDVLQNLPHATWPEDFEPLNGLGLAQPEMKADVVAAQIAGDVVDLFDLLFF
jgi:hypothetical protein